MVGEVLFQRTPLWHQGPYIAPEYDFTLVTFTPIVDPLEITLLYNINGGSGTTPVVSGTNKVVYDNVISLATSSASTFYRTGYDFLGWIKKTALFDPLRSNPTTDPAPGGTILASASPFQYQVDEVSNTVLYAVWRAQNFNYQFLAGASDANLTTSSTAPASGTVDMDGEIAIPGVTRDGYNFTGWLVEYDSGATDSAASSATKYVLSQASDVKLTAQWSAKTDIPINYYSNLSTSTSTTDPPYATDAKAMNTTFALRAATDVSGLTCPGYDLLGWTKGAGLGVLGQSDPMPSGFLAFGSTETVAATGNDYYGVWRRITH